MRYDVELCAERSLRLAAGERCEWIAEDRVLVLENDLDSGGHLVLVGYKSSRGRGPPGRFLHKRAMHNSEASRMYAGLDAVGRLLTVPGCSRVIRGRCGSQR